MGALVGWGVPHDRALESRNHVKSGRYLVLARGDAAKIDHARSVLQHEALELEAHGAGAHS